MAFLCGSMDKRTLQIYTRKRRKAPSLRLVYSVIDSSLCAPTKQNAFHFFAPQKSNRAVTVAHSATANHRDLRPKVSIHFNRRRAKKPDLLHVFAAQLHRQRREALILCHQEIEREGRKGEKLSLAVGVGLNALCNWSFKRPNLTATSSRDQTSVSHAGNDCHQLCDPVLLRFSHVKCRSHQKFLRINATWKRDSKSSHPRKMEELSVELPTQTIPHCEPSKHPDLQFDRLQPSDEDLDQEKKLEFGQFVAREATLDEEYWTAAWLRAESHWEEQKNDQFADSNKRKFADRAFNAIKRRAKGQNGQICTCIVTVKDTKNVKCTVVKSVVGTLDLSIRYLLDGETFPGERVNTPLFCSTNRTQSSKYGYISNLCVAKAARRQGIASNMLQFSIRSAMLNANVEQIYVHVDRRNKPAQELYRKMGFEIIERANSQLSEEQTYLLCFKT